MLTVGISLSPPILDMLQLKYILGKINSVTVLGPQANPDEDDQPFNPDLDDAAHEDQVIMLPGI